jgi:TonB family protein
MSKKLVLTSATVLCIGLAAFTQNSFPNVFPPDLRYEVRGIYKRPVKKEKLNEAKLISDVIPGYPVNWITEYVSVEILAACNGRAVKAMSTNDALSAEQKKILNTVDMGTDIDINVRYNYKDPVTRNIENNKLFVSMTIVPEIEAEYIGGYKQMIKYLKENSSNKIFEINTKQFKQIIIKFTVNEEGGIVDAKIFRTSADPKIDKLLLEVINKMPKWKPAENSDGTKVKQEFEFSINGDRGGC